MKETNLKIIAAFLINLIITLPIYIGDAHASINKISVQGNDKVEGFAKMNDALSFVVEAELVDEQVTTNKTKMDYIPFDKCTSQANATQCTLKFPKNSTMGLTPGLNEFPINLFKTNAQTQQLVLDDSKQAQIIVDHLSPQVKLETPKPLVSSNQNVTIFYEVQELACSSAACTNKCVGIKTIEFVSEDSKFKQTITPSTNSCLFKSNITNDVKKFSEGENTIMIKATDKFGQVSEEETLSFTVDTAAPAILQNSFTVKVKGIEVNSYSPQDVPAIVSVNITAEDLDPNSVIADLSGLNQNRNLGNLKGACSLVRNDMFICTWNVEINSGQRSSLETVTGNPITVPAPDPENPNPTSPTSSSSSRGIVINASDKLGNRGTVKISKTLSTDDKGPSVQAIKLGKEFDGKVYVTSKGNKVTATFSESTHMLKEETFLQIGSSKMAATFCNKTSGWACYWDNVQFSSSGPVSISTETTDILLNTVAESPSVDVVLDDNAPVITGISVLPVGSLSDTAPDIFKVSDQIGIEVNLTENNALFSNADFSNFITDALGVPGTCGKPDEKKNKYTCLWLSDPIMESGSKEMTLNFSDPAGNTNTRKISLNVLALDESAPPNFWKNEVVCSPASIDRQLGPLINQRMYCHVKLIPRVGKPETLAVSPASCSGDTSFMEATETFNIDRGSKSPFLKLTLKKDELRVDNIGLTCQFSIISKVGNRVTKNPEIENAIVNISLYNLPLGEVSDAVNDKIEAAKDDIDGIWDIIGKLNTIVNYAKKICQTISAIYSVLTAIHAIITVLNIAKEVPILKPFIEPTAISVCNSGEKSDQAGDSVKEKTDKFCKYVNCQESILWGKDVEKWINELPIYILPTQSQLDAEARTNQQAQQNNQQQNTQQQGTFDSFSGQVRGTGKPRTLSTYMDPRNSLVTAALFACIPGIIYNLDKFRQIKCQYVDCLENAVAKEGLPLQACEDQKAYSTCKYVMGEVFALIPYTAVFDHYMGLIKETLSNPFTALSLPISVYCAHLCKTPGGVGFQLCRGVRLLSLMGDAVQNVQAMRDSWSVKQDYCENIDLDDEDEEDEDEEE